MDSGITAGYLRRWAAEAINAYGERPVVPTYYLNGKGDEVRVTATARFVSFADFMYMTVDAMEGGEYVVWYDHKGYPLSTKAAELARELRADYKVWQHYYG